MVRSFMGLRFFARLWSHPPKNLTPDISDIREPVAFILSEVRPPSPYPISKVDWGPLRLSSHSGPKRSFH